MELWHSTLIRMSRDKDDLTKGTGFNRRRFVKALGAAGGVAAFGSLGVSSAAAQSGPQTPTKTEVHGQKRGGVTS